MALNTNKLPKNNAGDRIEQPLIEAGVYPARIVQILDMGLQAQKPYQGQEKKPINEISITYELVDCFCIDKEGNEDEDKPRWISETLPLYRVDQDKAKSTQRYLAADPNNVFGGDFSKLVDTPVNVTLVHNKSGEKTYVNIASIAAMRVRDADKCPPLKNDPKVFDLDEPDMEIFGSLPEWIQEKIKKNLNFNGSKLQAALNGEKFEQKEEKPKKEEKKKVEKAPEPEVQEDDNDQPWD